MEAESSSFWSDIKKYEETLAKDPQSYCFAPLSELYRKAGLLDDALSVARRGCEVHPNYVGGFMALGRAYYEKGMKKESRAALESVVRSTPENLLAQKILSQLYVEAGESAAAEIALRTILSINPGDLESQVLLESLKRASSSESAQVSGKSTDVAAPADEEEFLLEELEIVDDSPLESAEDEASSSTLNIMPFPEQSAEEPASDGFGDFLVYEDAESSVVKTDALPVTGIGTDGENSFAAEDEEETPFSEETEAPEGKDPLTTVTLAELYVSQGFFKRALTIYQELLTADPYNEDFRQRLQDLALVTEREEASRHHVLEDEKALADSSGMAEHVSFENEEDGAVAGAGASAGDVVLATLESWLENISRRRQ